MVRVGAPRGFGVPMGAAGRRNRGPLRNDDFRLVYARSEGGPEVEDKEPQQDFVYVIRHGVSPYANREAHPWVRNPSATNVSAAQERCREKSPDRGSRGRGRGYWLW